MWCLHLSQTGRRKIKEIKSFKEKEKREGKKKTIREKNKRDKKKKRNQLKEGWGKRKYQAVNVNEKNQRG